jgi:hypothetical protein
LRHSGGATATRKESSQAAVRAAATVTFETVTFETVAVETVTFETVAVETATFETQRAVAWAKTMAEGTTAQAVWAVTWARQPLLLHPPPTYQSVLAPAALVM